MTRSVFSERVIIYLYNQPLIAPVLQHLLHAVLCHTGTLLDDALLHSLCEGELLIQPHKIIGDIDNFHYLCTCQKVNQNCFRLVVITLLAWECRQRV